MDAAPPVDEPVHREDLEAPAAPLGAGGVDEHLAHLARPRPELDVQEVGGQPVLHREPPRKLVEPEEGPVARLPHGVGDVDLGVGERFGRVEREGALREPREPVVVKYQHGVDRGHQQVRAHVKLTALQQQRLLHVGLHEQAVFDLLLARAQRLERARGAAQHAHAPPVLRVAGLSDPHPLWVLLHRAKECPAIGRVLQVELQRLHRQAVVLAPAATGELLSALELGPFPAPDAS
mmetsp:Transcript_13927/g.39495  ORF Transcript_13927/g.39495 Transcript_13927/m.39495 type:complete len:235 (+) Transcript_13927:320-1024(+)